MTNEKFNVEYHYKFYLNKLKVKEEDLPPVQRRVMKQTFFAAWGQCLLFMRDDVSKFAEEEKDDDKAVEVLVNQLEQISKYFDTLA